MTNGFRSTEFWMTILGLVAGAYLTIKGANVEQIVAVTGGVAAYALSRGVAKHGNGKA